MAEKKREPEFVVTDRRKFTEEGELRDGASPREEGPPPAVPPAASASPQPATQSASAIISPPAGGMEAEAAPPPPSEAAQKAQHEDYRQSNRKLDAMLGEKAWRSVQEFEMTFERLVASLYMTAMVQLGLMAPEGEQPQADIMGARQTIDTLSLLQEKTKGNLSSAEQNLLQQSLFELRMAFLELTNAITRAPAPGAPGAKNFGGKK